MKVAVVMSSAIRDGADFLADVRALEAAGAELLMLEGDAPSAHAVAGAVAAVTHRIRIAMPGGVAEDTLAVLSRGRLVTEQLDWVRVAVPPTREGWTELLRAQEAAGAAGIVVAWDPRLIDLLRNPEPDDRSDLLMSTG
ncbi:MAG TPA: hypothetical protein VKE27_13685 [Candidatus Dormibacteraeota bacterium]|nr:hypothetical protein [Candidatus Dormibacteraeota bacterium]